MGAEDPNLKPQVETWEQYSARRLARAHERIKADLLPPKEKDPEAPNHFERSWPKDQGLF